MTLAQSALSSLKNFIDDLTSSLKRLDDELRNSTTDASSDVVVDGRSDRKNNLRWFVDAVNRIADEARDYASALAEELKTVVDAEEEEDDDEEEEEEEEEEKGLRIDCEEVVQSRKSDDRCPDVEESEPDDPTRVPSKVRDDDDDDDDNDDDKDRDANYSSAKEAPAPKNNGHSYATRRRRRRPKGKTKADDDDVIVVAPKRRTENARNDRIDRKTGKVGVKKGEEEEEEEEEDVGNEEEEEENSEEGTTTTTTRTTTGNTTRSSADDVDAPLDTAAADDFLDLSWMRDIPTKPNKVECLLCNKVFTRKYCTNTHMILKHSQSGGVRCPVEGCGRVCASQSHFDKHYANIHGEQRAKRLAERAKRREEAKERLNNKTRESRSSGGSEKPRFMCHMCPKLCSRLEYLRNHVALVHEGKTKQKCNKCGRGFLKSRDLARHKCSAAGSGADGDTTGGGVVSAKTSMAKTPCPHCGKHFTKQWIKPHISIEHKGEKETCSVCNRQFSCKGSLKLHYRNLHEGIRAKCSFCDQSFRDSWRLKMHVHSEHEGKRYKCEDCGKEYRSKDNLGRHRKIHAGVRFRCHFCPASFGQKAPLTRHVKSKHDASDDAEAATTTTTTTSSTLETAKRPPRTVDQHLRAQQQQVIEALTQQQQQREEQEQPQQQRQQSQQFETRVVKRKLKPSETVLLQEVVQIREQRQQQQQHHHHHYQQQPQHRSTAAAAAAAAAPTSTSSTSTLVVESGDSIRVGNISAILQTANGQTLTLLPQHLAQLTQQLDNWTHSFGTFSLAPVEVEGEDGGGGGDAAAAVAASVMPARFAIAATGDHHHDEDEAGTTVMHAIQMEEGTTTTTQQTALMTDEEEGAPQQIHLDTMATLTPIQTNDGDKETKFYLIPSGSWSM